jgi:hypothetical protein
VVEANLLGQLRGDALRVSSSSLKVYTRTSVSASA